MWECRSERVWNLFASKFTLLEEVKEKKKREVAAFMAYGVCGGLRKLAQVQKREVLRMRFREGATMDPFFTVNLH